MEYKKEACKICKEEFQKISMVRIRGGGNVCEDCYIKSKEN